MHGPNSISLSKYKLLVSALMCAYYDLSHWYYTTSHSNQNISSLLSKGNVHDCILYVSVLHKKLDRVKLDRSMFIKIQHAFLRWKTKILW
jgi:hypothetical protein